MIKATAFIILTGAVIIFCMFLPFIPGKYDGMAVLISFMSQVFGFAGATLAFTGLIWALTKKNKTNQRRINRRFMVAVLVELAVIATIVALIPLSEGNILFAVVFLGICSYIIARLYIHFARSPARISPKTIQLCLIAIPVIVICVRFLFIEKAVEFSRNMAIANCADLIARIERYHERNGRYPLSIQALRGDIYPGVTGVAEYFYEPNGEAYNIYFKQFSGELDVDEIVMYNKLDQHAFAAHTLDILEYSGEELAARRGDRQQTRLSQPHWVSIRFD